MSRMSAICILIQTDGSMLQPEYIRRERERPNQTDIQRNCLMNSYPLIMQRMPVMNTDRGIPSPSPFICTYSFISFVSHTSPTRITLSLHFQTEARLKQLQEHPMLVSTRPSFVHVRWTGRGWASTNGRRPRVGAGCWMAVLMVFLFWTVLDLGLQSEGSEPFLGDGLLYERNAWAHVGKTIHPTRQLFAT